MALARLGSELGCPKTAEAASCSLKGDSRVATGSVVICSYYFLLVVRKVRFFTIFGVLDIFLSKIF